jgi:hypothetical protein
MLFKNGDSMAEIKISVLTGVWKLIVTVLVALRGSIL